MKVLMRGTSCRWNGLPSDKQMVGISLRYLSESLASSGARCRGTDGADDAGFESPPPPYDLKGNVQHDHPEAVGRCAAVRSRDWTYVWRMYAPWDL